ncbi:MAG: Asp23/Gls24 family envelope stress response protein [Eubacteriales bacterium]
MAEKITAAQTAGTSVNFVFIALPVQQLRKAEKKIADKSTGRMRAAGGKTKGTIRFTEEAIATLALISCSEVPGLALRIEKNDLQERMIHKSWLRVIRVQNLGENIQINLSITVKPGYRAVDVAKQAQLTVKNNIENMAGICVYAVNVHVSSIQIERELLNAPLKEEIS